MPHPTSADRGTTRLASLIEEARARAHATGSRVMVSLAEPASPIDPLAVIAAARRGPATTLGEAGRDAAMYWERPAEGLRMAAIGAATALVAEGDGRFATLDRAWDALRRGAIVDDPSAGAAGVGPTLLGGFAFEPDGPRDAAWQGFPSALLVLPRVLVTATPERCWITTSVIVEADGTAPSLSDVVSLRAQATAAGATTFDPAASAAALEFDELQSPADWRALVDDAVATIRAGSLQKVVVARAAHARAARSIDPVVALRHLREAFPSTHVFGIWRGDRAFVGASPERLVRLHGDEVESSSLAGSIRRGATPADDAARMRELLASTKDRAEHEMVREALRQRLDAVCAAVDAPDVPTILTLPHVHHLHTPVRARLRPGHTMLDVVERLHPTPAVGGAPHDAALRYIREHERLDRGWYAAPVGWLGVGQGEFAVALRSGVMAGRDAWIFAGCGIVADSDPEAEYEESVLKLRPMQLALSLAARARVEDPVPLRAAAGGHAQR